MGFDESSLRRQDPDLFYSTSFIQNTPPDSVSNLYVPPDTISGKHYVSFDMPDQSKNKNRNSSYDAPYNGQTDAEGFYFSGSESGYLINGSIGMAHAVFSYQIPMFGRRFFWEFRGGAGATYFHNIKFHFSENIMSRPLNMISICYDAGTSRILYLARRFFLEASFDYTFTINKNDLMGGMLASFGGGWQL